MEEIISIKDKLQEDLKNMSLKYDEAVSKSKSDAKETQTSADEENTIFQRMSEIIKKIEMEQNMSDSTKLALQTENQGFVLKFLNTYHDKFLTIIKYVKTSFSNDFENTFGVEVNSDLHNILKILSQFKNELNSLENQIINEDQPVSTETDPSSERTVEENVLVPLELSEEENEIVYLHGTILKQVVSLEKQNDEIEELNNTILEYQNSIKQFENSIELNEKEIRELKEANVSYSNIIQNLTEEKSHLLKNCEELKEHLKTTNDQVKDLQNTITTLNKKIGSLEQTNKTLSEQVANLNELLKQSKDQEIEIHKYQDIENELKSQQIILKVKTSEVTALNAQLDEVKKNNLTLSESNNALNTKNTEMEDKIKILTKDLEQQNGIELKYNMLKEELQQLEEKNQNYKSFEMERNALMEDNNDLKNKINALELQLTSLNENQQKIIEEKNIETACSECATLKETNKNLKEDINNLQNNQKKIELELELAISEKSQLKEKIQELETQLQNLIKSREELIALVQTKHNENLSYHTEIQRLSELLTEKLSENKDNNNDEIDQLKEKLEAKTEETDKLIEQNEMLRKKCEVFAENILQEQESARKLNDEIEFLKNKCQVFAEQFLEKENKVNQLENENLNLSKNVERLQSHLMEIQDHYTEELVKSEEKRSELENKMREIEQREKECSTIYTSVSIRANQQVEALQQQLQQTIAQREELKKKISEIEEDCNKKSGELNNLQGVLQQFQKDKESDVSKETFRITRQIKEERLVQEKLQDEINTLKKQLEESKQGLQAASRLTDQLHTARIQIGNLKKEVTTLTETNAKNEEKVKNILGDVDGKVDKSLIKNLIVGFLSTTKNLSKDQSQILKIIATILDFNQQDHEKINKQTASEGSWLNALLAPGQNNQNSPQESLTGAFIRFLEKESKPENIPSLPQSYGAQTSEKSQVKSGSNQPAVLNQMNLPIFTDFAQNRNSSSILKDVLKDN